MMRLRKRWIMNWFFSLSRFHFVMSVDFIIFLLCWMSSRNINLLKICFWYKSQRRRKRATNFCPRDFFSSISHRRTYFTFCRSTFHAACFTIIIPRVLIHFSVFLVCVVNLRGRGQFSFSKRVIYLNKT